MKKIQTSKSLRQRLIPAVLIAGLPVVAVASYSYFFASDKEAQNTSINSAHLDRIVPASGNAGNKLASVDELTVKLAARLEISPDDPSGWLLLARSYDHMQEPGKARDAYAKAVQYGASDSELEKRLSPVSGSGK